MKGGRGWVGQRIIGGGGDGLKITWQWRQDEWTQAVSKRHQLGCSHVSKVIGTVPTINFHQQRLCVSAPTRHQSIHLNFNQPVSPNARPHWLRSFPAVPLIAVSNCRHVSRRLSSPLRDTHAKDPPSGERATCTAKASLREPHRSSVSCRLLLGLPLPSCRS